MVGEQLCGVLILTAFSQRELIEQARDAGALAYLVKPFQKSDLVPALELAIARHRELQALGGEVRSLEERLESRKLIDRAKGRLMDAQRPHGGRGLLLHPEAGHERPRSACGTSPSSSSTASCSPERGRPMAKILLLDGNSLTYRAFFALPTDMATAGGQVTNAVFGFTSMLINLVKDHQPDAHRGRLRPAGEDVPPRGRAHLQGQPGRGAGHPPPADGPGARGGRRARRSWRSTWPATRPTTSSPRWPSGPRPAATTWSSSPGDRDTYQLVEDPHVKVLYNRRGVSDYAFYDEAGIVERTGVTPGAVPGVRGAAGRPERQPARRARAWGRRRRPSSSPPTAGIDGIFAHLDEQTPKLRASLAEHEERVRENARVMVLRRDVPGRGRPRRGRRWSRRWPRSSGCSSSSSSAR